MSINPSLLNIRNKDASLRKSGDDIKWRKKIKKDLNEIYGWYDYHMKFSETDGKAETKKYKKKIVRTLKHETLPYPKPISIDESDIIKMEPIK